MTEFPQALAVLRESVKTVRNTQVHRHPGIVCGTESVDGLWCTKTTRKRPKLDALPPAAVVESSLLFIRLQLGRAPSVALLDDPEEENKPFCLEQCRHPRNEPN